MEKNQMLIEEQSRFDMESTISQIIWSATEKGWSNPATHDLQQSLAKSGKHVRPVKVIEICKPEYSGKMLELSDERIISVMMPCRISVYEKDNGKIYISLLNAGAFASSLPENIGKVMTAASDETLAIIQSVL
jgi:uncharacterized protein (DUF302 family)